MMNKTRTPMGLSFILCVVLIAARALTTMGCQAASTPQDTTAAGTTEIGATGTTADTTENGPTVLGEGATSFYFNVVDKEGATTRFEIHTDKTIVGDALTELGLIDGEMGDYGLYVKVVNGITADYSIDGTYWAFYVNGEYGMTGVDQTEIQPGQTYDFRVSK